MRMTSSRDDGVLAGWVRRMVRLAAIGDGRRGYGLDVGLIFKFEGWK